MILKNQPVDTFTQEVDLTLMLDVIFILLIFFIVTASFVTESGVALNKSEKSQQQAALSPIAITVLRGGEISIADRPVDLRSITPMVTRLRVENPKAQVSVSLHQRTKTEIIITVLDALAAARVLQPSVTLMHAQSIPN